MEHETYNELVKIYKELMQHWIGQTKPPCLLKFNELLIEEGFKQKKRREFNKKVRDRENYFLCDACCESFEHTTEAETCPNCGSRKFFLRYTP